MKGDQEEKGVRVGSWIWICIVCILLILPTGIYLCLGEGEHASGTIHTARPVWRDAKGWNWNYLKEWGEYYAEHFTLRETLVSFNSLVQTKLFQSSPDEDVIVGKDGWLYYASTLEDYLGIETLSEEEISDIVYNLTLLQEELEKREIPFVFVMAPNKNSLYPEYMPERIQKLRDRDQKEFGVRLQSADPTGQTYKAKEGDKQNTPYSGNAERLFAALETSKVHYIPVKELFKESSEILYHKEDSHWNNKGAAMVMEASLDALGMEHEQYEQVEYDVRRDFTGDLYGMLYPAFSGKDAEIYYHKEDEFSYVHPVKNNYDPKIETQNPQKENACVVFRDSFGNSLLPFIANEFSQGYFSRAVPFPAYQCEEEKKLLTNGQCCCIMEIVERHLNLLAQNAPILASEGSTISEQELEEALPMTVGEELAIHEMKQEGMVKLHGSMEKQTLDRDIYVCIRGNDGNVRAYQAYRTSEGDERSETKEVFTLYVKQEEWDEDCEIFILKK